MASRLIRADLLDSDRWLGLPSAVEKLAFIVLTLSADDIGCLEASDSSLVRRWREPCGIKSNADAARVLATLARADLVRLYQVSGKRFLFLPRFRQRFRAKTLKYPAPPPELLRDEVGIAKNILEIQEYDHAIDGATPQSAVACPQDAAESGLVVVVVEGEGEVEGEGVVEVEGEVEGEKPVQRAKRAAPTAATAGAWNSYSTAYRERYGVDPVRNARVNGQVAQFVARVGAEDAPAVAAFYVAHPDAFYVRRGHPVGSLLADAEKLRTEWATGRTVTATRARQVDRAATTHDIVEEIIRESVPRRRAVGST
jgi:hypothetical protein